jgi:cytochrome c5
MRASMSTPASDTGGRSARADGDFTGETKRAMASNADTRQGIGSSPSGLPGGGIPHEEAPTSFIKTPAQLITVVILGFAVPIVLITLLVNFAVMGTKTGAGSDSMTPEAIEARIRPVAGFELSGASGPVAARSGEEVYKAVCTACHEAGVAGAPKHGDKGAWSPRIATGLEALVHSALKGKGAMPPQGGGAYSDLEITRAVVYMANDAGASFEEPKAPAAEGDAAAEGEGEKAAGEKPAGEKPAGS